MYDTNGLIVMPEKKIVFVSTMAGWPATEELWWRSAVRLAKERYTVSASIVDDQPLHPTITLLKDAGVRIQSRPSRYSLWRRASHFAFSRRKPKILLEVEKLLQNPSAALVVFSEPYPFPPIELLELCITSNLPFVTIANGNEEHYWPSDPLAERYRKALLIARRCYFVSRANWQLAEKEIGCELSNAEIIWSQYNVNYTASPPWPELDPEKQLRFACVGRLHPPHKGQDILLETLAEPRWSGRTWHLTFHGNGPMRDTLERYTARLGLSNRVTFAGHSPIEEIWSNNHVMVMPSRCEGGPLVTIEAMLCGRPVVGTRVGLHTEIIADGVTGFLVDGPTVAALSAGLEKVWDNRAGLENMGKAGARRIRELVPSDPIGVFSNKLKELIDENSY